MGTTFDLPHARTHHLTRDVRQLAERDEFELYALTPDGDATDLADVTTGRRAALLLGAERSGLTAELLATAEAVRIPMRDGVDSLNVAAATAIACWALRRHRLDER
jgi:tRNA G18 (ribose-2'-O)-methylase SpoU